MVIELKNASSTAKIETLGAELISYINNGQEYMWQKDAAYWGKCSPVLFPVIGNLRNGKITIEGNEYAIPKHGFCKDRDFEIVKRTENSVVLKTGFDNDTLKMYPYKFEFTMAYTLDSDKISIEYTVLNEDNKDMYYCIGSHPAINVPLGDGEFTDYVLQFDKTEDCLSPVYDLENLEISTTNRVNFLDDDGKTINLKYSLFDNDAIIMDHVNSDKVTLKNEKTNHGVVFTFKGYSSIAFWTPTKKDAPFLCLEPWNGMAVRSGESDDIKDKFGIQSLKAKESKKYSISIMPM